MKDDRSNDELKKRQCMDHGCERAIWNLEDGINDDKVTNKKEISLI